MTGSGTQADPYIIYNVTDLQDMANDLGAYYELANNINASATSGWNAGAGFNPVGTSANRFKGNFNGKGFKLSSLFVNRPTTGFVGLFGYCDGATIKNASLTTCDITGQNYVGALSGRILTGSVTTCSSSGTVSGDNHDIGGLSGSNSGTISNCSSACSVFARNATASLWVGGLVGHNANPGIIQRSYATGSISGNNPWHSYGGLVGRNQNGTIRNCYARGSVSGDERVGGLVGVNGVGVGVEATIDKCYSTGTPTGTVDIGGLVGQNNVGSTVSNSFWDTETSGQATSSGGTSRTTAQMKTQSTFTNWDFNTIWSILLGVNDGYPHLNGTGSGTPVVSSAYRMTVKGMNLPYRDLDGSKKLHVMLKNLSPTSKASGVDGEVVIEIVYEPAG